MSERTYLCIDLKSFYASVECVERKLDPLITNLVVADPQRGEKTICLAISPSMKALGIPNRCRVFQIPKHVSYIKAVPRMKLYIQYAADIYAIYLRYISKEDIHVYSIDEAFLDVTYYLDMYHTDAASLARSMMEDIRRELGVTAVAGIGTNLYLAKIAMDITAKHTKERIGYLNEELYQQTLWRHRPLTDFWRIGRGTVKRLERMGILTMEDIAKMDEAFLYRAFGVDAELLIDHAWGRESTTMKDIKEYRPKHSSISTGQVLPRDYRQEECELIVKEMTAEMCLQLAERRLVTHSVSLVLGYANELELPMSRGTASMSICTNSFRMTVPYVLQLYQDIAREKAPIRRLYIAANTVMDESYEQYDLFTNPREVEREKSLQKAALTIKQRYGKNALIRGMDLQDGSTTRERNCQIGGHKSGE